MLFPCVDRWQIRALSLVSLERARDRNGRSGGQSVPHRYRHWGASRLRAGIGGETFAPSQAIAEYHVDGLFEFQGAVALDLGRLASRVKAKLGFAR
jgi:hypothetical protein